MQLDRDSNPGPNAYWANALPTELMAAYTSSTLNCDLVPIVTKYFALLSTLKP